MADTLKIAGLFPGQGSQYAGMVRELFNEFSWTRELFEEASDAIGMDLAKLCLDGPEDELQLTANAQPAILTTSYAWYQVLAKNLGFKPSAAAGHSLGEYSALLAAGALSLPECVRLVRTRGTLMQSAVPRGVGKMAALLGLNDEQTRELCKRATQSESSLVVPANFNSPGQVVIAGHTDAVERAELLATTDPELKARKVIPLKVSAPFHCPLMKPVGEKFVASLESIQWKALSFPVIHNLDAKAHGEGNLVALLRDQIDHPVLWTQCQGELETLGHSHYIEVGPGKVLSGLGKRIVSKGSFVSVESAKDVKAAENLFREGM